MSNLSQIVHHLEAQRKRAQAELGRLDAALIALRGLGGKGTSAAGGPRRVLSVAARKRIYAKVRQIMYDEVPFIFVHYETLNYAMQPRVHGSTVLPSLELRFKDVWLT